MGTEEVLGIIELIRISNARTLSILEQARFVDELKSVHNMSTAEIAGLVQRAQASPTSSDSKDLQGGGWCPNRRSHFLVCDECFAKLLTARMRRNNSAKVMPILCRCHVLSRLSLTDVFQS